MKSNSAKYLSISKSKNHPKTRNFTNESLFIEENYMAHNILPTFIYMRCMGWCSYDFFYTEGGLEDT